MVIHQIPVEFEIEGLPQYMELEDKIYEINRVNRLSENGSSSLLIIYQEKKICK